MIMVLILSFNLLISILKQPNLSISNLDPNYSLVMNYKQLTLL